MVCKWRVVLCFLNMVFKIIFRVFLDCFSSMEYNKLIQWKAGAAMTPSRPYVPSTISPVVLGEKNRDPYDGLRPWSAITHGLGSLLAVIGTVLLLFHSIDLKLDLWHIIGFTVYGTSMICLYTASTLYHSLNISVAGGWPFESMIIAPSPFLLRGVIPPFASLLCGSRALGAGPFWVSSGPWLSPPAVSPFSGSMPLVGFPPEYI